MRAKWNSRSLLKACEGLLKSPTCQIQLKKIQNSTAHVEYDDDQILLTIDPAQSSLVEGCLHEALHMVLLEELENFNPSLEEKIVKAFEKHLWVDVMKKADTARWRKIIKAKLT